MEHSLSHPLCRETIVQHNTKEVRQVIEREVTLRYAEYLPAGYAGAGNEGAHVARNDNRNGWPLVLFLHGAGERGDDLERVSYIGLTKRARNGDEFPFIIIAPQCPEYGWWDRLNEELEILLRHCIATYNVDTTRIYLTGLSMGGFGTWHFTVGYPHAFAAIAPICGGGDPRLGYPARIRSIAHVPVWAFHGDSDPVVPVKMSVDLVDELKAAGAPDLHLTIYPDVAHDSWTAAYDNPELYRWMLARRNNAFAL